MTTRLQPAQSGFGLAVHGTDAAVWEAGIANRGWSHADSGIEPDFATMSFFSRTTHPQALVVPVLKEEEPAFVAMNEGPWAGTAVPAQLSIPYRFFQISPKSAAGIQTSSGTLRVSARPVELQPQ